MTDHDDLLKDLDAALQVEPSRAFADGVRARVTRSHIRTRNMWLGFAAAASVGLATMTLWRPAVETPVMVAVAPVQAPVPVVPIMTPDSVIAMPPSSSVVIRRETTVARAAAPAIASEPRLEVITNQGAVLRDLWADYQGRRLVLADGEHVVDGLATKSIEVNPIVVPPIVVSEIGKEPGLAGATPVIRRINATKETR